MAFRDRLADEGSPRVCQAGKILSRASRRSRIGRSGNRQIPRIGKSARRNLRTLPLPVETTQNAGMTDPRPAFRSPPRSSSPQPPGDWRVALVGAGPGHAGLLTLRGAELLGQADVVLFDGLSNQDLLVHAPRAEKICVGKHGQSRIWQQAEIIAEILRHASAGRRVVRLKGGDPAVFARTSEEVDAIRGAGFAFEIVPGITAALAAGSYAGIPITHRGLASAVAMVTGHEEPGKAESHLDWQALAAFPGTLVVYMGVTTAAAWTGQLIAAGKSPDTPAAIVRRCSLPDQQTVHCTLGEVALRLTPASRMRPPVITIIGEVTRLAPAMSWFDRRPLFGKRILVTRPADPRDPLAARFRELGADVIHSPAIAVGPVRDPGPLDDAIENLNRYEILAFCSASGVRFFLERLLRRHDLRRLAEIRLAAVGAKTAEALAAYHLKTDVVPNDFHGEALADELIAQGCRTCLIVRASRGDDTWTERLAAAGVKVTQVVAYENEDVDHWDSAIVDAATAGRIDWVTLTSRATAKGVIRLLGDSLKQIRIACLSPHTSAAVRDAGLDVDVQADPYTMHALADALCRHERQQVQQPPHDPSRDDPRPSPAERTFDE